MKIYHNPRCGKSRQTLALIEEAGIEPEIIEYLKTPPTAEELDAILKKLKLEPQELMRKGEAIYKELKLAERELSRDEAIAVMLEHPKLIERPIVVQGRKAVLGRPPENVKELL
ncbi:arsenate reductase (glutaredoxin) [Gimesia chilikensis]|uniref:arsenate reductase (glutaredoxin) n=1 Tax=Gimesia chilikensis TaxID=2605989 RepID=UPI0011878A8D|nr:arsenate reductase (glutaredoxin) [Gimesia chilikensis]MCR9234944.1 arsenate reductase (glutaredoxin) [bacterium]QDT83405.1 Arsenate reductase [Gimesia chilikensis]